MNCVLRLETLWKAKQLAGIKDFGIKALQINLQPTSSRVIPSCCATSGVKGNTRNVSRPDKRRYRGWKVIDGDHVHNGYLLAKQIHSFRWYPGANVVAGRRRTLTATCSGTIRFTKEIFIPGRFTKDATVAAKLPRGALLYKTFINIVPDKDVGRFRLVEQI